ncbi:MAG: hypothetical protein GXP31_02070 [Kiritimatiellaeota bacterium]|nr:hypothetical protein [Kiritimatiellota bacterium]
MKRRTYRLALEIAGLIALFLGLVDFYCETRGLPSSFLEIARAEIARRGVWLDCGRLQVGLVNGIRFRDVTVWDGQLPGTALLRIGDLRVRPELVPLLSGRFVLSNLVLQEGQIYLPDPDRRRSRRPFFLLSDVRAQAGLRDGLLHVRSFGGMWNGVRIKGGGTIRFGSSMGKASAARPRPATPRPGSGRRRRQPPEKPALSCVPLLKALRPEWRDMWRRVSDRARAADFAGKATLDLRFGVPSAEPQAAKVRARLALPRFRLGDAWVRSLALDCTWTDGQLRVPIGRAELGAGMAVTLEGGVFDTAHRTVAGRIRARIRPESILQLLSRPVPPGLEELVLSSPAELEADLTPSPLDYRKLRGTFSLTADKTRFRDLTLSELRVRGACGDGRLRVTEAIAGFGGGQDAETVRAALSLELADGAMHAQISASIRPLRRLLEAGVRFDPGPVGTLAPGPLVESTVQIEGYAWGPARIRNGTGSFRAGSFTLGRRAVEGVNGDIRLTPKRIEVSRLAVVIDRDTQQQINGGLVLFPQERAIQIELSGNLAPGSVAAALREPPKQLIDLVDDLRFPQDVPEFTWRLDKTRWDRPPREWTQTLKVTARGFRFRDLSVDRLTLDIRGANSRFEVSPVLILGPTAPGGSVQQLEGSLNVDLGAGRLSAAVRGRVDPGRTWKALRLKRNPIVERIEVMSGKLPEAVLTVRDAPLSPAQWRGTVEIHGGPGRFNGLEVLTLDSVLEFEPGKLRFRVRHAAARNAPDIAVVIGVDLARKQYSLTGRLVGDPRIGAAFIGRKSRDLYLRIWRDFTWKEGEWPDITIRDLRWGRDPETGKKRAGLDASLRTGSFRWRKLLLDSGSADIELDLPNAAVLRNITFRRGKSHAEGECRFDFAGQKTCRIAASATFDPNTDIPAVVPAADGLFRSVKFAPGTTVRVSGELPLGRTGKDPDLAGELTTPRLTLGKWPITDVRAAWGFTNAQITVGSFSGTSWGGTISAAGQYRLRLRQATGAVTVKDLEAGAAFGDRGNSNGPKSYGKISGKVDFTRIEPAPQGGGLLFVGRGNARMTGADLWDVPLLNDIREFLRWTVPEWFTKLNPLQLVPGYSSLAPIEHLWTLGRISKVETSLTFAGDHVQFEKIATDGDLLALTGQGRYYWRDGRIDLTVKAVPLEKTWLVPTVWKYVSWFFVEGARCTGTLKDHKWRPVSRIDGVFPGNARGAGPRRGDEPEKRLDPGPSKQQE